MSGCEAENATIRMFLYSLINVVRVEAHFTRIQTEYISHVMSVRPSLVINKEPDVSEVQAICM